MPTLVLGPSASRFEAFNAIRNIIKNDPFSPYFAPGRRWTYVQDLRQLHGYDHLSSALFRFEGWENNPAFSDPSRRAFLSSTLDVAFPGWRDSQVYPWDPTWEPDRFDGREIENYIENYRVSIGDITIHFEGPTYESRIADEIRRAIRNAARPLVPPDPTTRSCIRCRHYLLGNPQTGLIAACNALHELDPDAIPIVHTDCYDWESRSPDDRSCRKCSYFLEGDPPCCNAFHSLTGVNLFKETDCSDWEGK